MTHKKAPEIRFEIQKDKASVASRTLRAGTIGTVAAGSALWAANPALKDAGGKVVTAGTALGTAESHVEALASQLAAARTARDADVTTFDDALDLYVANCEAVATTPEDAQTLGLVLRQRATHALTVPANIKAVYRAKKNMTELHIERVAGISTYLCEVSPQPVGPASFVRLPGTGSVHALIGYAPGEYWARAASVSGRTESAFSTPVHFVVR